MRLWPGILAALVVVGLGWLDDWYGRFEYMTDGISYLDIAKAIHDGDWHLVFSPYWSIGYPLILAATRGLFPDGPQGEWTAAHVVNLIVFVATYLSFVYFLKVAQDFLTKISRVENPGAGFGFLVAIGTAFFLLLNLLVSTVERVNPDLLVTGVFLLSTALSLQFLVEQRFRTAVLLGLLLGFGYVVKAIFLPLAGFILLAVGLVILRCPRAELPPTIAKSACVLAAMAVLAVPYIATNSITAGFFTLGETGSLNYAWNVNHLPGVVHWQGAPVQGTPVHPTQLVLASPHVYVFAEPFHVTYPPWFNPFYWYQGYDHYFSAGNELAALKKNLTVLRHFFLRGPRAMAAVAVVALSFFFFRRRAMWWQRLLALWPVYLPALLAIAGYTMVVIEPRYLIAFWLIALTTPFIALFTPTPLIARWASFVVAGLVVVGCGAVVAENERDTFHRAIHHETYLGNPQWKAGLYLTQIGIRPGDKVASVHGGMVCTWAKVSGVHIVAEIPLIGDDTVGRIFWKKIFSSSRTIQPCRKLFSAYFGRRARQSSWCSTRASRCKGQSGNKCQRPTGGFTVFKAGVYGQNL
jgi:hypothetical protein